MARRSKPSWSFLMDEFHCRGCGGREAYHSRARGFFERNLLPLFYMQPVRCERCDQRSYVFLTVEALDRVPLERKESQAERLKREQPEAQQYPVQSDGSKSDTRVA